MTSYRCPRRRRRTESVYQSELPYTNKEQEKHIYNGVTMNDFLTVILLCSVLTRRLRLYALPHRILRLQK